MFSLSIPCYCARNCVVLILILVSSVFAKGTLAVSWRNFSIFFVVACSL